MLRLLLLGAALAIVVGPAAASTNVALNRMILKSADLPAGFAVVASRTGPFTNREIVKEVGESVAPALERYGRITGYRANYVQRDPEHGAAPGMFSVQASISLYRTQRGAHAAI